MTKFDLNKESYRLLMNEPFFAGISRRIDKTATTSVPTAAVRVNEHTAQFELLYNPEFMSGLSDKHRSGVLKHEYYHCIFEHVTGRIPEGGLSKKWNIATDLAINSHLQGELPEGCLFPGVGGTHPHFETHQSAEAYYKLLQGDKSEEEEEGEGRGRGGDGEGEGKGRGEPKGEGGGDNIGDHSHWGGSTEAQNIAKERLKDIIKKAAQEASKNGWGTVGADCRKEIMERIATKVDWRKVLRYFIKTSQRADRRSTVKRLNRKYPYIHPGKKVRRQAKIAISIDQSGSVSDELLNAFFNELSSLAKLASFTVVPFDTEVLLEHVYEWKLGEKREWSRVRYGGTDFNAPTKWVNERNFDGHIVLTDLEAPKPVASKCQRMWMAPKRYTRNPYFKTGEIVVAVD